MNIVLIGMRGSGKTTIGKRLASHLAVRFMETDDLVEKEAKMSIRRIVESLGWQIFRDFERKVICKIAKFDHVVISTGGGVVTDERNVADLTRNGFVVWLKTDAKILAERLKNDESRPKLTNAKFLEKEINMILTQRKKLYMNMAHINIDTGLYTMDESVNYIVKNYKEKTI